MKVADYIEIYRSLDPKVPIGLILETLNGYYKDICNSVEPSFDSVIYTADGEQTFFAYTAMPGNAYDRFMKPRDVKVPGIHVKMISNSIPGDIVVDYSANGFHLGQSHHNGLIPIAGPVYLEYYAYPAAVTESATDLPFPWADPMILWRTKADHYAERRHWDRAGYYNRRYEKSLLEYRRMYRSSGPQIIINTDTTI